MPGDFILYAGLPLEQNTTKNGQGLVWGVIAWFWGGPFAHLTPKRSAQMDITGMQAKGATQRIGKAQARSHRIRAVKQAQRSHLHAGSGA